MNKPLWGVALACSLGLAGLASPASSAGESQLSVEEEIRQLQALRNELERKTREFDQRIEALEARLQDTSGEGADAAQQSVTVVPALASVPEETPAVADIAKETAPETWGRYEPGKGFVLARTDMGELDFSAFTYARYLNQKGLDSTYTDAFGRTTTLDLRNDIQFQKLTMNFKGWLFDPKFRYLFYTWTANTSQGDGAQVVVAGNLGYQFDDAFSLYAGIGALPSTRSTNYTFPNWLKNDHRTIADEFFRGSYTTGLWASGALSPTVGYRAMIGNNLSQLGVNAVQLDNELNTFSGALWWMPTTGEYGPGQGFGDYEYHEEVATLFGVHFTHSREDAQGQSEVEGFENSQIRLSDGTRIFSEDPFLTGGNVRKATYEMLALNAGFKYRGLSLEGEYYYRKVDDFVVIGEIPVTELEDQGFQLQGSAMLIPKMLQGYAAYSYIDGEYGNPSDVSLGLNYFPMSRRELRLGVQALRLNDSPVGYSSVPMALGGNGWVFSTDVILAF